MAKEEYRNNLKVELAKARKTQKWLAGELGFSEKHIGLICREDAGTTIENWRRISKVLGASLDDLLNVG